MVLFRSETFIVNVLILKLNTTLLRMKIENAIYELKPA